MPLLFPRWPVWARALWRVVTPILPTHLVRWIFGSQLQPEFQAVGPWGLARQQAIETGWWLAAARGLAGLTRLMLSLQSRS